jgi:YVTN family beta-propeller protein
MKPILKKTVQGTLWGLTALVVIACVLILRLIYVGQPAEASSLQFRGFVLLPKGAFLTVLDYLTVSERSLFVTDESTGSVYKIELHGEVLPQDGDISVFSSEPATHGVALDPAKRVAYVTRSEVNAVDVFDPATMKPIARIPVAEDPDAVFFDSAHNLVYVANGDAHLATLIDPDTRAVVATIQLGGKPEFSAVDPQTRLRYQNLRDINAVAAVDLATRSVVGRWHLAGCIEPSGMAIDEAARRLFIGCSKSSTLIVFDLDSHNVTAAIPVGGGPDSVAYDAALRRIYTAGKAGVMTVIEQSSPDTYKVLDSIKLHYGAHTLVVDPTTNNLYVGYASLLVRSRVAVFSPRRAAPAVIGNDHKAPGAASKSRPPTPKTTAQLAHVDNMNQD